jgi:hypothetical protein
MPPLDFRNLPGRTAVRRYPCANGTRVPWRLIVLPETACPLGASLGPCYDEVFDMVRTSIGAEVGECSYV